MHVQLCIVFFPFLPARVAANSLSESVLAVGLYVLKTTAGHPILTIMFLKEHFKNICGLNSSNIQTKNIKKSVTAKACTGSYLATNCC